MAGKRDRSRAWVGLLLLGAVTLAGCYTLRPMTGPAPEPGNRVAFSINDAGRAVLGGLIGPGIERIEGRLLDNGDTGYLLAVTNVDLVRGGQQVWRGEQVRVPREYVVAVWERKLSMGKSIGLGVGVVGGFVAFLATRSLIGGGENPPAPGDSANTLIGRP